MGSATHRYGQTLALPKIESSRDVGRAGAAHDQRRVPIECPIADQARRFIVGRFRRDQVAGNLGSELSDGRRIGSSNLFARSPDPLRSSQHLHRTPVKRRCSERRLLDELSSSDERRI